MTDGPGGPQDRAHRLAQDWVTIWQSELSAAATDRERAEAWSCALARWADLARAAARLLTATGQADGSAGRAAPESSAGPSSAAAAPDARDHAIERLAERVAELERRLARRDAGGAA